VWPTCLVPLLAGAPEVLIGMPVAFDSNKTAKLLKTSGWIPTISVTPHQYNKVLKQNAFHTHTILCCPGISIAVFTLQVQVGRSGGNNVGVARQRVYIELTSGQPPLPTLVTSLLHLGIGPVWGEITESQRFRVCCSGKKDETVRLL
jgi:hypothetical protein